MNQFKSFIKEWSSFFIAIILIGLTYMFIAQPFTVNGESMEPTFENNDRVITYKLTKINRFDTIVAEMNHDQSNEHLIIKRVIGLPGDTIEYKDDVLYVNGKKTPEPHLKPYYKPFTSIHDIKTMEPTKTNFKITVPKNKYYVLGDNRLNSRDSRHTGPIAKTQIKGKVILRIWPITQLKAF